MISRISRGLALAVLPWIFAACSVSPTPHAPGELGRQFTATVPGTWTGQVSGNGTDCRMIKQFNPDGTAKGVLIIRKKSGSVSLVMPEVPFTSRWRVVGDVVESYGIRTGVPGLFKPGEVIRDTILSVSPNRIVSRSHESGGTEIITRLNSIRQ